MNECAICILLPGADKKESVQLLRTYRTSALVTTLLGQECRSAPGKVKYNQVIRYDKIGRQMDEKCIKMTFLVFRKVILP